MKTINFGFSYRLPDWSRSVSHIAPWDGTADCHEDGYLTGCKGLLGMLRGLAEELSVVQTQHV